MARSVRAAVPAPAPEVLPPCEAGREGAHRALLLCAGDLYRWVEVALNRLVSTPLNPLYHTGTIAVFALAVATVTGIYLFLFYRVGTTAAYGSVEAIVAQPLGIGSAIRSLHRYASDAALLAALLHGLKMLLSDRFWGARWVGWVTGVGLVALVWVTGATGYWLVWDVQAQVLSLATARLLDALPFFPEPLVRTFLHGDRIQNFLFFIILFLHITIPLLLGLLFWLHVMRLARPRFFPPRAVLWTAGAALVAVSLIRPALSGLPADLARLPGVVPVDFFFFAYFPLTRVDPRVGWAIVAGASLAALAVPWVLKGRPPAVARVEPAACTGCTRCYRDCPYEAITMVPRRAGDQGKVVAVVDPTRCVGCGICVGACDTGGILLGDQPAASPGALAAFGPGTAAVARPAAAPAARPAAAARAGGAEGVHGSAPVLVYACRLMRRLAGRLGPSGALPSLPGAVVAGVPCVGFLHPETIREALDSGARGVYIAACLPEDCHFREGSEWLAQRLTGERLPKLKGVPPPRVRLGWYSPVEVGRFVRELRVFCEGAPGAEARTVPDRRPHPARVAWCTVLLAAVSWALGVLAGWPWTATAPDAALLRIAVKHVAGLAAPAHAPSAEEIERLPRHMRPQEGAGVVQGRRADTALTVAIDGRTVLARIYRPTGLKRDGPTYVYEELPVAPGPHRVEVRLGGVGGGGEQSLAREVVIRRGEAALLEFADGSGWSYAGQVAAAR